MELLKHLQTLQAVVEHGGFKKAADALETTQPSVTNRIQQLEKHFGTKLLLRGRFDQSTTRAVVLTEAGKVALTHTHHINMHLTAIETGIANLGKRGAA
jgi:DNA-binding transcriptional LysR family regulator